MLTNHSLFYHTTICLKRAFVVVPFGACRLKVWGLNKLAKPTTKLSDLLVGFNVETCVDGEASLKQALKFRHIHSRNDSNIIGLQIPSTRQSLFSLLVIGPFPDEVSHWRSGLEN